MLQRARLLSLAVVTAAGMLAATIGLPGTAAVFTSEYPVSAIVDAGHVFPGERDTPPFSVTDVSSGSPVDASSPFAFEADGQSAATSSWAVAFAPDRYIEFTFNSPLPTGVGMASAAFSFRFASLAPGATACFYFEVQRESTGDPVEVHGSDASPLGCVTGTSFATTTTALAGIANTTIANDLRVRVYGRDSASGPMAIDAVTIGGDYGLATFTLYPIEVRDLADTTSGITHWGPAGP